MNDLAHAQDTAIVREGFGSTEIAVQRETSATAVAARARAQIEARCIMALQRPRNLDQVRQSLLHECQRPAFARGARYSLPRGGKPIEGPTIRFAEAALRCMRNMSIEVTSTYDDPRKAILHISVTDLESNVPYEQEVVVQKTVERRLLRQGQRALGERTNSYGDRVFIVEATDDEILQKTNALVSKAVRTLGLRHLPGDILDEAMARCIEVAANEDAKDPDAARKALLDAFAKLGVKATDLAEYLGHDTTALDPSELADLRAVFAAVRDGEITWRAVLEAKTGEVAVTPDGEAKPTPQQTKAQEIIERRKQAAKAKAAEKAGPGSAATAAAPQTEPKGAEAPPAPAAGGPRTREPGEDDG